MKNLLLEQIPVETKLVLPHKGYRVGIDASLWCCKRRNNKPIITDRWRKVNGVITIYGYRQYCLYTDAVPTRIFAHTLLMTYFVKPRPENMECCHNDGNPLNNNLENLRWDTHANNLADRDKHGTLNKGKKNGGAILNETQVVEIRKKLKEGKRGCDLALEYGVSRMVISSIKNKRKWAWLKNEE